MLHAHVANLVIATVSHQSILSTRRHSHIVWLIEAGDSRRSICTASTSITSKSSHQRVRHINDSDLV